GFATFFYQGGNAGACGTVHSDSDKVVALQTSMYSNGAHCGKKVLLKNKSNGKTCEATVADECPTCKNKQSVDLSKAAFDALAAESVGMFDLEWGF
ncbi:barwin-like endoglucanase, partial [Acaromyces ingoldii]